MTANKITYSHPVRTALDIVADIPLADLEEDPYGFYTWMRDECPVVHVPETGRVLILTWDLCKEAGVNDAVFGPTSQAHETVYGKPNLMAMTGDGHRRLRAAANASFRPRAVITYYDTLIRATAVRYLKAILDRGRADATLDIFEPISQRIVGDVLGFTDVDDDTLTRWFKALADYLVDYGRDPRVARRSGEAKAEIHEYLGVRLPALAADPDGSAMSHLLHDGMSEGQVRSVDDLLPTIGTLIVGGFQEPAHLIGSTLHGLLANPDELAQVRGDLQKWSRPAIEEGLRWLSPFGITEKLTTADVTIGGVVIPEGTEVALVMGSANRDPAHFDAPDVFDIDRPDQDNVSFGFGGHFCIGHNTARAIGEVVLAETLRLLPELRLDPARPPTVHGWLVRGAKSLPIEWTP